MIFAIKYESCENCAHIGDELFVPRDCAHKIHRLCETNCDTRAPTIDHRLMLDYHIPLGYFVLTLVTLFDPTEIKGWKQW